MIEPLNMVKDKKQCRLYLHGTSERDMFDYFQNKINEVIAELNEIKRPGLIQKIISNPNAGGE